MEIENVKTPGGLKNEEIKILSLISKKNEQLNRYSLSKLLKMEKKRVYRIVKKFTNFGYVKLTEKGFLSVTETGKLFA